MSLWSFGYPRKTALVGALFGGEVLLSTEWDALPHIAMAPDQGP